MRALPCVPGEGAAEGRGVDAAGQRAGGETGGVLVGGEVAATPRGRAAFVQFVGALGLRAAQRLIGV